MHSQSVEALIAEYKSEAQRLRSDGFISRAEEFSWRARVLETSRRRKKQETFQQALDRAKMAEIDREILDMELALCELQLRGLGVTLPDATRSK